MRIDDVVTHALTEYKAKDFDRQQGYMLKVEIGDGVFVETGIYLHWNKDTPVDVAIDLSCMSGCTQKCKFCAAGDRYNATLSAAQMLQQALTAVGHAASVAQPHLDAARTITFSFEGMGEPSVCAREVTEAIGLIRARLGGAFRLQFIVSTLVVKTEAIRLWADADLGLQSLQFSLHAPHDDKRRELLGATAPIAETMAALAYFQQRSPATQIKVNYLLLGGENDSPADQAALLDLMQATGHFLKVSYLNETPRSRLKKLRLSPRHDAFLSGLKAAYPHTYSYGSFSQIGISCGQLATYVEPDPLRPEDRESIRKVYDEAIAGNVVLFLGAGASSTFESAGALAERLYKNLPFKKVPYRDAGLSLGEVADIFGVRSERAKLEDLIKRPLLETPVPPEHAWLPWFPWRAIYTTNYDTFVEQAYEQARAQGNPVRCMPIVNTKGLCAPRFSNELPLIKLHGCIDKALDNAVISDRDYMDGYTDERDYLFKMLEIDCLRSTMVFAGYGLRDQELRQKLFNLAKPMKGQRPPNYAVIPIADAELRDARRRFFNEEMRITLISCKFDEFMREMARLSRMPVVMLSGSGKPEIQGGATRVDRRALVDELSRHLAALFDEDGVHVRTGATAKDKLGYLVARHMAPGERVRTYLWNGIDKQPVRVDDQVQEMVGVHYHGFQPSHVIERLIRESNVVLFVGGSGFSLEEFKAAEAANKLIIPVALGDASYASDIVHGYFSDNRHMLDAFKSDPGYLAKQGRGLSAGYLSADRLARLHLRAPGDARSVADTVIEIVRNYRLKGLSQH